MLGEHQKQIHQRLNPAMKRIATLAAVAFTLAGSTAANAVTVVPIPGLFNTGVNDSNVTLGNNVADPHWRLTAAPTGITLGNAFTGVANGSFPIGPWLVNNATSRWLTPTTSHTSVAAGAYTYQLSFTLTPRMIANTGQFTARLASDNSLDSIFLNSTAITAPASSFTAFSNFSSAGGFVTGLNTLSITVRNAVGAGQNPTGLRVEFLTNSIQVLPEPGTWALLVTGFGLVGAGLRRRRRAFA